MLTLEQINTASESEFTALLDGTYEHSPWIVQAAAAFGTPGQILSQAPQLAGSKRGSAQTMLLLQVMRGALHPVLQTPPEQSCPGPQRTPHWPQLALSVWRETHLLPQMI